MWKIVKDPANINRFIVRDSDGTAKGDITFNKVEWVVEMLMVPAFTRKWMNLDTAMGYVRGIEQAVNVYGKEMAR